VTNIFVAKRLDAHGKNKKMALKNYISKINLALRISRNLSFLKLLINSKKHSAYQKGRRFTKTKGESIDYDFAMNGKSFQLAMRTYRGDIEIFYEVFWSKIYQIPSNYLLKPTLIVDLGAHIGLASIYFALQNKAAKIIAIEASATNFQLLKNNTSDFENIQCINKAIYTIDGYINFDDADNFSYNTKISETGTPTECISMHSIMNKYGIENIDLLKIDIEGAEAALLSENNDWLHKVQHIIIELHKPYNLEQLSIDLKPFGFKCHLPDDVNGLKNIFLSR